MSLDSIKLPFLRIRDMPDKFRVGVTGNTIVKTRFTKEGEEGQTVLEVLLEKDGTFPIVNSPPDYFLAVSETAKKSLRKMGISHLDTLKGQLVTFKKVTVGGFAQSTLEATKVESW